MSKTLASGFKYIEYYLYSEKAYEVAASGASYYLLNHGVYQNAPIVVTSSGCETTSVSDAWAQIDGSGKYNKVGYGDFSTLADGSFDSSAKEFALHPDSSGKLMFNQTLSEHVFVEYESGPSGYYLLDSLDFNPIRGQVETGFVHFSDVTDPASLYLMTSQSTIKADRKQRAKLTASLFDIDFDRVADRKIVFEVQSVNEYTTLGYLEPGGGTVTKSDGSGLPIEITETTDTRGEAHVKYLGLQGNPGIQQLKAYYLDSSGIYDTVQIGQFYFSEGPFVLDLSLLDTLDYLT